MSNSETSETSGVIAPPPLIFLGFLAAGIGLNALWPLPLFPQTLQYALGAPLVAAGVAVMALALARFRAGQTPVQTWKPTTALVASGPYRYSRNPIYLAMAGIYAGIGVLLDSAWVLALLVPLLIVIRYGVIGREERYLERKFGAEYQAYRARVRRWL